jgi:isopenicillin-N N-acyltransferase like protein
MTEPAPLELHPGFKLIRISGPPYRRGLQHGRLLRLDVRRLRDAFYRDVVYAHGRPIGLAFRAVTAPLLLAMHRHIPAELRTEMHGVAAGANLPYWDILTLNCFDDLLHALWLIPPFLARLPFGNRLGFACSSFALLADRTAGGRLLHGRNLDYEVAANLATAGAVTQVLKENLLVVETRPDRGHAFLSVGWPGVVGVVTSINTGGISLACLTSTTSGETPNGIPLPLLYRQISQCAGTLGEAERMLRAAKLTIGNNLLVASGPQDDARVFELSPHQVTAREPRHGAIVTTNHFMHPAMVERQTGWVVPSSVNRYSRLTDLCGADGCRPEDAAAYLRDTGTVDPETDAWSCLANPGTIYSSVAEPASGRLWLRPNDRPEREFVELTASWANRRVATYA